MASTTHPHAFHFDRAVDSYWEASADPLGIATPPLVSDERCDVADRKSIRLNSSH